jgi:nucleotide-binding universal stress UspA family protein
MTVVLIVVIAVLVAAVAALLAVQLPARRRPPAKRQPTRSQRILFPFTADELSRPALDAALRLAIAEDATLVPVFLAHVPLNLPLEAPLPRQSGVCMPLQEAIEQRATQAGVPVDSRIERGRSYRHALRNAIANERFDRIVVAAATNGSPGFDPDDVAWLLNHAGGEIVVLRPGRDRQRLPAGKQPRARTRGREREGAASR